MTTEKGASKVKMSVKREITQEDVRNEAYHIYKNRIENGIHGDAFSDWIQAERELGLNFDWLEIYNA